MPTISTTEADRSATRAAVLKAYNRCTTATATATARSDCDYDYDYDNGYGNDNEDHDPNETGTANNENNENYENLNCHGTGTRTRTGTGTGTGTGTRTRTGTGTGPVQVLQTSAWSLFSGLLSCFEFLVASVYNCLHIGLHASLVIAFLALIAVRCLGHFHDRYFVTILNRARRTDFDLKNEITYFNRRCASSDVTTSKHHHIHLGPLLRPVPKKVAKRAGRQAVRSMMKHGSVMIPKILSDATIEELRLFISEKNERVQGTPDQYPMSQSYHRISYGIESTEHPAVVRALKEIHEHRVFAELIRTLVGDENPALSEITAITAWAGAESQSWHPDVKPDGNGVMFGRTYSHSYSLFLPLQDTVGSMGPTDLCPGTHMCANDDLWDMCEENKIGLHERDLSNEGVWMAGDGALLNQQVWHRGTQHTDEDQEDRVVFIVSFLKRPRADDPRQLARGTYFHQKWLNWGSTWQDMADAAYHLKRPWNVLRCLHLYKPSDRSWGYDLFTATTLRVANGQMGGEPGDLENLIENVMVPLNYPEWLQGTIDYESDDAWQMYLTETIQKTYEFLFKANAIGLVGYALFVGIASSLAHLYHRLFRKQVQVQVQVPMHLFKTSARRLFLTHGSVIALGLYVWHGIIRSSQWAIDIDSGTTLMRPFPHDPIFRDEDPGVRGGKTTLPTRADVLIGTRYHTKAIGAYNKWLDYHPGNRVFNQFVDSYGGNGKFYHSLLVRKNKNKNQTASLLPASFTDQLALSAFDTIRKRHGGRFVMQDYRSGDWKILSDNECMEYIHSRLFIGNENTLLGVLKEETDLMLNRYRFGVQRKTLSMAWNSQLFVADLSKDLFVPENKKVSEKGSNN
eukprot:jgi/Psemu1/201123/e_gw1.272.73.1